MPGTAKMNRQLLLYDYIITHEVFGPNDLMKYMHITRRTLQRDLKDFRDCGLINLKYKKENDRYIKKEATFDPDVTGRRKSHLIRLYRIGTLIKKLPTTYNEKLEYYESWIREYKEWIEEGYEYPDTTPEDIKFYKEEIANYYQKIQKLLPDLKAEYYKLFPDSNERTRQRDFSEMRDAGFNIYYEQKYHSYVFLSYDQLSDFVKGSDF